MGRGTGKSAEILQAAELLLHECRIHELTMDDIAAAAGVGKGTIYNHFKNKDDLLFQLATQGFEELCDLVLAIPENRPFQKRLITLCELVSEFFQKRRAVMRMIQEHEGRLASLSSSMKERWLARRQYLVEAVASIFRRGIDEGDVRQDLPAEVLATMLLGMMRARGRDYLHMPEARPPVTLVVDLFLQGAGSHR